ncbi:hypothetical protein ACEPUV_35230 [Burkholderia ubonensis]
MDLVTSLERRGIRFESITEAISTESPGGTLISARSNSANAAII